MTAWYTSDLHLGHANIIKFCGRPWPNVDEMNEGIVSNWNELVDPNWDEVYVLGDLALGKLDDSLAIATRLNGRKFLVPGNHDRCWSGHKKVSSRDIDRYTEAGFTILHSQVRHFMGAELQAVLLCHFPYAGDSQELDRYVDHRPKDEGLWLLHGHTHWATRTTSDHPRQIHVGMDAWHYRPVHLDQILEIINEKEGE